MNNMVDYVLGAPGGQPKVAGIENTIARWDNDHQSKEC
jgi:hypothetical protein